MKHLYIILLILPLIGFGQTPITQDNIYQAVGDWLADPISGEATYGDIIDWDVSNVTSMSYIFSNYFSQQGAEYFNEDIGDWDVSNVTDMIQMFRGRVQEIDPLGNIVWDANSFNQRKI